MDPVFFKSESVAKAALGSLLSAKYASKMPVAVAELRELADYPVVKEHYRVGWRDFPEDPRVLSMFAPAEYAPMKSFMVGWYIELPDPEELTDEEVSPLWQLVD